MCVCDKRLIYDKTPNYNEKCLSIISFFISTNQSSHSVRAKKKERKEVSIWTLSIDKCYKINKSATDRSKNFLKWRKKKTPFKNPVDFSTPFTKQIRNSTVVFFFFWCYKQTCATKFSSKKFETCSPLLACLHFSITNKYHFLEFRIFLRERINSGRNNRLISSMKFRSISKSSRIKSIEFWYR